MPAKKAAKKSAQKNLVHHDAAQELRRAYEYLGRIEILEGALAGSPFVDVTALANLAQQQLASGHTGNAADLLRAAEHISFAALAPREADASFSVSAELNVAITAELEQLSRRAEDHWSQTRDTSDRQVIADLYARTLDYSRLAFTRGAYRPALELARAAEALAHITEGLPATLPGDRELSRRMAS
jgi:hypothetical protein